MKSSYDIIIAGGGLAGLTAAILLGKDYDVLLIDPDTYPRHKLCGEYLSNEVLPLFDQLGINIQSLTDVSISKLHLTLNSNFSQKTSLPLGAVGVSRFCLDKALYDKVIVKGCHNKDKVVNVIKDSTGFKVITKQDEFTANQVLIATGKRSILDKSLDREFIKFKTPWLAIKRHYNYEMDKNEVGLHHFDGGYAGISMVENDTVNLCYLANNKEFSEYKNVQDFERKVLSKNSYLESFFEKASPLWENPLSISQISFQKKSAVVNDCLAVGDAAGLIHPLCGNGMAMAIHSAFIASKFLKRRLEKQLSQEEMLQGYTREWEGTFGSRLYAGKKLQSLLLQPSINKFAFKIIKHVPKVLPTIIKHTHGQSVTYSL
ncbi:NAD(P)/FAD-dependent oxidoreductase [Nonlabens sp. SY33080]|uniref:NAD(P)/FAD-dependent oxidoreductase n=1 Tax=Nonlabens sp. SY33080 TaxID=2719911 RepID=UPI001428B94C|nr:NAD(P)/FAD-dependent oxidoreductase [Nonlabens sp. SY33080]